jgi:hypothetical protein
LDIVTCAFLDTGPRRFALPSKANATKSDQWQKTKIQSRAMRDRALNPLSVASALSSRLIAGFKTFCLSILPFIKNDSFDLL